MSSSHVPILLGSYNATLDLTDQLVLQVNLALNKSPVNKYLLLLLLFRLAPVLPEFRLRELC